MDFKYILLMLLVPISYVASKTLEVSSTPINTTRIIKDITGITITACFMECERENGCHSIAITERAVNQLPVCYLLKEDNGNYKGGDLMTTIQKVGSEPAVNGQWGCWVNTSTCSATCGGGYLNQSRQCDSPEPKHGGENCTGLSNRTVSCNTHSCPEILNQTRKCDSPEPEQGGKDCEGTENRTIVCNTHSYPAIDGVWGSWTDETTCTLACGGGTFRQRRKCDSPKPQNGGDDCSGSNEREIVCNTHACPVDGAWGPWRNVTRCSATCAGGTMKQARDCDSPRPQHGGRNCEGPSEKTIDCNTHPCPVHGNWSSWRNSTECNVTCGGGRLNQTRKCDSPEPKHGGKDCNGTANRTIDCNTHLCPVVDGIWGSLMSESNCTVAWGGGKFETNT